MLYINIYRITKFYTDIQTDIVYNRTGYDVIIYIQSEVIWKKLSKIHTASDGLGWTFLSTTTVQDMIMNFYARIEDNRPHKSAGYDVTS